MATMYSTPPAAIAYAIARVPESPFMQPSGDRDPAAVLVVNPTLIRATAPANLGDADSSTIVRTATGGGDPPANPAGGTIEVKATTMANVDLSGLGAIDHVVFRAIAWRADNAGTAPFHTNFRMGWKVAADTAEAAITNDAAAGIPSGTPFYEDADGIDPGDQVDARYFVSTGAIATQPNGQPWDQAALDALVDVAVRYDYAAGVDFSELEVAEIWCEVYSALGSPGVIISPRLKLGSDVRRPLKLTNDPH